MDSPEESEEVREVQSLLAQAERADREADFATEEALLARALGQSSDAVERASVHAAFAVHHERRCQFGRAHHHQRASASAFAEAPGGAAIAEALELERQATAAFTAWEEAKGLALLRAAHDAFVAHLGEEHPFVLQVTHTLAGRLQGDDTRATRLALRERLLAARERRLGPGHYLTMMAAQDAASVLQAMGKLDEALALFERAFDGLLAGGRPEEASRVLLPLSRLCRQCGAPERTARRETALLVCIPDEPHVRWVRLWRAPDVRRAFNVRAVEHAARLSPEHAGLVAEVVGVTADTAPALLARLAAARQAVPRWSAADWVLWAMEALVHEQLDSDPEALPDEPASRALNAVVEVGDAGDDDPDGGAERAWQRALFDELWRNARPSATVARPETSSTAIR